ncbi:hypothetical protein BGX24_005339, partial [Mortierella sp. AD032]
MASQKPNPVRTAAFTTLGEKRLYIVGGFQGPLPTGSPTAPGVNQAQLIVATGDDSPGPATVPVATFDLGSNSWSVGNPFATSYTASSGVLTAVNPTIDTII